MRGKTWFVTSFRTNFEQNCTENTKHDSAKISNFGFGIEIRISSDIKIELQKFVLLISLESRFETSKFEFSAVDLVRI